jgi:predicted Zn-dependent peptidase
LKKKIKTLDEKIREINKITSKDIMEMSKLIFKTNHLNLAIIGPFKENGRFKKLLKF